MLAFELDPQPHHHVRALYRLLAGTADNRAHLIDVRRHQRTRREHFHRRAHLPQSEQIALGDARMADIAEDRDRQPFQRAEVFAHGEHIQKRLRGVFVHAVARVDDVRLHRLCKQHGRAAHGVTDDDDVVFHRVERLARIDERLALLYGRGRRRDIDDVRPHVLGGKFKAATGARAVLIEQRRDRFALQVRQLFNVLAKELFHAHAHGEDLVDLLRVKLVKPQNVFVFQHMKASAS